jgi:hypothetical protein
LEIEVSDALANTHTLPDLIIGWFGPCIKGGRIFKLTAPAIFSLIEIDYEEIQEDSP